MTRVLAEGGYLYFAVPVGKEEKFCFNAHRIFCPLTILEYFGKLMFLNNNKSYSFLFFDNK